MSCSKENNPHLGFTPNRLVFSKQDGNNLHKTSLLSNDLKNGEFVHKNYFAGSKFQPLYINFKNEKILSKKFPIFKDKQILFILKIQDKNNNFTEFTALNLETLQEVISIPLELHFGLSTGIISTKHGKFYFLSRVNGKKKIRVEGNQYWEGLNYINSIDLNGKSLQRIPLDLDKINQSIYSKKYKANLSNYFISCKTALNGNFSEDNFITFGCSNGKYYSMEKNLKGSLFKFKINKNGEIDQSSLKVFFPAGKSNNLRESRDSGVYLAGAAPTIFKDHILFTSGNGAFKRKSDNYGCSLIKLNRHTFKFEQALPQSEEDFGECYFYNTDYSASGVSTFKDTSGEYASIRSKDGNLSLFNIKDFHKVDEQKIGNKSYGAPTFFSKNDQSYIVSSSYSEKIVPQKKTYQVIGTFEQAVFLKKYKYKKGKCIGHLPKNSKKKVQFLYSGNFRGHLLQVEDKSSLYKEITNLYSTSFLGIFPFNPGNRQWAKYKDLEISINQPDGKIDDRFILINVPYILDIWVIKSNFESSILDESLKHPPIQYLRLKKDNCNTEIKGFEKVYLFYKDPPENEFLNDSIKTFKVSSETKLQFENNYQLSDLSILHRTNFPVYKTKDGDHIYLFTYSSNHNEKLVNHLGVLDLGTFKLLRSFEITGTQHFSNILIIDNKIVVPTIDKGINFLSLD